MFLPGPFRAGDTMAAYNFWSSLSTRKVNEQSSAKNRGYEEEKEEDGFGGRGLPGIYSRASLTQLESEVQSFMAAAFFREDSPRKFLSRSSTYEIEVTSPN